MNVWVVRAEFGKHADNFRNGGYVALDFDISEPYPVGEQREAFVEAYKNTIRQFLVMLLLVSKSGR